MDSSKKGFRRMCRTAFRNLQAQQTSRRNSTDLSRAMVAMNHNVSRCKVSIKERQAVLDLLGTLIDEEA